MLIAVLNRAPDGVPPDITLKGSGPDAGPYILVGSYPVQAVADARSGEVVSILPQVAEHIASNLPTD